MAKIVVDKLAMEIMNELEAYGELTREVVKNSVDNTAKLTCMEIRENAAQYFGSGEYSGSWSWGQDRDSKGKYKYATVVYSEPPYYRLAHLLEKGHATRNGGRTREFPHIAPAEKLVRDHLLEYLQGGLEALRNGTWKGGK